MIQKIAGLVLILSFTQSILFGQSEKNVVPDAKMQMVYDAVKTPYKYGLIVVPSDDSKKIDCPSVFKKGNSLYMTYLVFDGRGYETWLSTSKDLLNWEPKGRIMSFSDTTNWDGSQVAGYIGLQDHKWGGSYELQKYDDKYWMSYFGGKTKGYEAGDLSIGIANTSKNPAEVHEWERLKTPVFTASDTDTRWWENRKLFKSTVIWDKKSITGHPFVMFYNANGDSSVNNIKTRWFERIGMSVSDDMVNWKRFGQDPVLGLYNHGITGDPIIQRIDDVWIMFYFGAFWKDKKGAYNRFACSYDLVNWTDWKGDDLIKSSEPYDEKFAHKSFVIKHNDTVYHFYCAVNNKDQRGIAVATSKDLGKSKMNFK